jgi:hypothetical protein
MVSKTLEIFFHFLGFFPNEKNSPKFVLTTIQGKSFKNYKVLVIYLFNNYVFDHLQAYNMFIRYICLPFSFFPF